MINLLRKLLASMLKLVIGMLQMVADFIDAPVVPMLKAEADKLDQPIVVPVVIDNGVVTEVKPVVSEAVVAPVDPVVPPIFPAV